MFQQENHTRNFKWGTAPSPFGELFMAFTSQGLSVLTFIEKSTINPLETLKNKFPNTSLKNDNPYANHLAKLIFDKKSKPPSTIHLDPIGTAFQKNVWLALLQIPFGKTTTYSAIARVIGINNAARAVGNAIGSNPVAILIPCHRVIRADGKIGGYRWGTTRKNEILAWERNQATEQFVFSSLVKFTLSTKHSLQVQP
jgi:AraC family transcriptional regulator, regulatory protein of adaptative response / methylated-DNA-[protein]-cysteine methyltransferase